MTSSFLSCRVFFFLCCVSSSPQFALFGQSLTIADEKSEHFTVRSYPDGSSAKSVLQLCEAVRAELQRVWHSDLNLAKWEPRCEIVVHSNRESYQRIVAGDFTSFGSSLIKMDAGKVVARRIDLLIDPNGSLSALPHELTHVVLADQFNGRQPPLWMDEGIAMLADTREKQLLHHRDCSEALTAGRAFSLKELLRLEQFTSAEQVPAFYGQSLTLVRMLSEQGKPQGVVPFAIDTLDLGIDKALQKHYAIRDVNELEDRWRIAMNAKSTSSSQLTSIVNVRFQP